MREVIKNVFLNYIVCSVFGGVLQYLSPEKMRKTIRGVIVAVILASSILPLINTTFSFRTPDFSSAYRQEQMDSLMHTANLIERKIYKDTEMILINSGVDEYEIYVEANPSDAENTVYLERYSIEVDKKYKDKIESIRKKISKEYTSVLEIGVKNE